MSQVNLTLDLSNKSHVMALSAMCLLLIGNNEEVPEIPPSIAKKEDSEVEEKATRKRKSKPEPEVNQEPGVNQKPASKNDDDGEEEEAPSKNKVASEPTGSKNTEVSRLEVRTVLGAVMEKHRKEIIAEIRRLGGTNFATLPDEHLAEFKEFLESLD